MATSAFRIVVPLALVVALVSHCDTDTQQPTTDPTQPNNARQPAVADLTTRSLTAHDLPAGWITLPATGNDALDDCGHRLEQATPRPRAEHQVAFRNRAQRAFLFEYLDDYGDQISDAFDRATTALASCSGADTTLGPNRYQATIRPIPFPATGDRSAAFAVSYDGAAAPLGQRIVVIATGQHLIYLGYLADGTPDTATVHTYAELADRKARSR